MNINENLTRDLNKYRNNQYYKDPKYRENHNKVNKIRRSLQKWVCIYHYSHGTMRCVCCNEFIYEFLSIDHINNDGANHRKEIKNQNIYEWLVIHNFPEGFQTYCFNCNLGKRINNGQCPHLKILK